MRTSDVAARYGGEEFALLLPNTKASGGVQVAERVNAFIDGLAIKHEFSEVASHVTVSIGIATISANPSQSMADLLKQADIQWSASICCLSSSCHYYSIVNNFIIAVGRPKLLACTNEHH
jgi:diguanylate cyclase (GGDEF)-like protein